MILPTEVNEIFGKRVFFIQKIADPTYIKLDTPLLSGYVTGVLTRKHDNQKFTIVFNVYNYSIGTLEVHPEFCFFTAMEAFTFWRDKNSEKLAAAIKKLHDSIETC